MAHNVFSSTQDFPYLGMQVVHTPLPFQRGHIALNDGHYQLLVVVLQRHGWNHSLEAVLNEHQHSRREERGRDELVAQCLQSTHNEEAPPTWDSGHYTGDRIARWNGVLGVVPNAPTPLKKEGRKGGRIPSCFQDQTSG